MRKLLFPACAVLLAATNGFGAPCATDTLNNYMTGGFSCNVDDLLFQDFSFSSLNGGGAGPLDPADVLVTPVEGGFSFQSAFDAGPSQRRDILLGFLVSSLESIIGSRLEIQAFGAAGTGNITVTEAQCLNGTFQSNGACSGTAAGMFVYANSFGSNSVDTVTYGIPVTSVDVIKDIGVTGGTDGTAQFSLLFNTFDQEGGGGGPGQVIPEPGSLVLIGSGLLLAGFVLRRVNK